MPTRDGDVVISRSAADPSLFAVWHVEADLQQTPSPTASVWTACGRAAALTLAKMMSRAMRGSVFLVELDTLTWTNPIGVASMDS